MINSIWQNKGLYNISQIGFWGILLMQLCYLDKKNIVSIVVWGITVVIVIIGIIIEIKVSIRLMKINNFIHGDSGYIYANLEQCEIISEDTTKIIQYSIIHETIICDSTYKLKHIFYVERSNKERFERCLKNQDKITFVYSRKNPNYHFAQLSNELKKIDIREMNTGWRKDRSAFLFTVLYCVLILCGTINLFN